MSKIHSTYERIVCLSQESAETLVALGLESCVVGLSKFVTRPTGAFAGVPRIGGFSTSDVAAICALEPDLVLCYSDVQAELAKQLTAAGLELHVFNHTTLAGMLRMVRRLAALTGVRRCGEQLAAELEATIEAARQAGARGPRARPRVYFEEWDEPMICGITWVSELIELAGGEDVFAELAQHPRANERVLEPAEVVARAPEVILASWCGKPLNRKRLVSRPGFERLPAVRAGRIFELEGAAILAPGPGLITEGLPLLRQLLTQSPCAPRAQGQQEQNRGETQCPD